MAGEKPMSDVKGNGGPKGARLQKAVAELQEAQKLFPLSASMIEGLQGAKDAAVEEVTTDLNSLRAKLTGLNKLAADIEIAAGSAKRDADRVATAELALQETARGLEEKATGAESSAASAKAAAEEVQTAISTLRIRAGDKEYTGAQALGILATVISRIPERISKEVERVVTAEITTDEGKTEMVSGTNLVAYLVSELNIVKVAAGKACSDSDHANDLLQTATELVGEAQKIAGEADAKLAQAQAKIGALEEELVGARTEIGQLKEQVADSTKDARYMFGALTAMMRANGLNTEMTGETHAAGIAEAEKQDDS